MAQLAGLDQLSVLAGQTHGVAPCPVDGADDAFVDGSAQHHFHDLHRGGIGNAQAVDVFTFDF